MGFEYFSNKAAARQALCKFFKEQEVAVEDRENEDYYISCFSTPHTTKGLLTMLECWGSHPDNG